MSYSEEQVREIFFEEMREIFENIDRCIVVLERTPNDLDIIRNLFREVHTLKGSSGVFGLREICDLTHHAEDILDRIRESKLVPTDEVFSALLRTFDRLKDMMSAARENKKLSDFDNTELIQLLCELKETGHSKAPEANKPPPLTLTEGDTEWQVQVAGCDPFFLMGIDPITLILNARDIAKGPFHIQTHLARIPRLMEMDPERCYTEFHMGFVSAAPEGKIQDIFEFAKGAGHVKLQAASGLLATAQKAQEPSAQATAPKAETPPKAEPVASAAAAPAPTPMEAPPPAKAPKVESSPAPSAARPEPPAAAPVPAAAPAEAPKPAPKPTPVAAPVAAAAPAAGGGGGGGGGGGAGADSNDFVRIKKEKLDQLMNLVGELITVKNLFVHLGNRLELVMPGSELNKSFKEGTGGLTRLSSRLQESVMNARMVPVGTVFTKYTRLVRDVAKKLNKKVNLIIEGEDTELDKTVSEAISDPIMHLLRNAIDHGIEMPDDRLGTGKNEVGNIILKASYEGNNVKITVRDDGRGIDHNRIRDKVIKLGLLTSEAADALPKKDIIEFIFHSGFSTASEITDISGRGVGMDVVRNNIRKSSGSIFIDTDVGKGTEFRILLPLSLAVIDALLIGCHGETYAIPQELIIESVRVGPSDIHNLNSQPSIDLREEVIPLLRLHELLPLKLSVLDEFIVQERNRFRHEENSHGSTEASDTLPIVILQIDNTKFGLLVTELFWQEQIMIKPMGGFLANIPVFSGACIMGNGAVVLVLDPKELYAKARISERAAA